MSNYRYEKQSRREVYAELLSRTHTINSAVIDGVEGQLVEVQARAVEVLKTPAPWHKAVTIAGMPSADAKDLLTRLGGALARLGFGDTPVKISVNIFPEGSGPSLDLPIALVLLQSAGYLPDMDAGEFLVFGSIDLHGEVRHTPGALALALAARNGQRLILPDANGLQARLAKVLRKVRLFPVSNLQEAVDAFANQAGVEMTDTRVPIKPLAAAPVDFADVIGQPQAKRAAEIAAAGGHGLLMISPPGCGKTLIAGALSGVQPPLSQPEKVMLTALYNAAGMLTGDNQAVWHRPFRKVHHNVTEAALIGGGRDAKPGEITLAHLGVLFLDEIAEFDASTLDALRQPMEEGAVHISRVHRKVTLPCRFSLVAACNPCPCGGWRADKPCGCGEATVRKYQSTISGPIMDRIDLKVELDPVEPGAEPDGETSEAIRTRVVMARETQRMRLQGTPWACNAEVPGSEARKLFNVSAEAMAALTAEQAERGLSMRAFDRVLKVARTIADLAMSDSVEAEHVAEAASFA